MDYEQIKRIIDDVGNSKLTSLEIDFPDGMKIRLKKGNEEVLHDKISGKQDISDILSLVNNSGNRGISVEKVGELLELFQASSNKVTGTEKIGAGSDGSEKESAGKIEMNPKNEEFKYIKSPMVGTFYSKPSPNEDCFVQVGERVSKGRTTCIIEAMKLMNEIESEFDGEVVEIIKQDGEPVEYGENLIKLR